MALLPGELAGGFTTSGVPPVLAFLQQNAGKFSSAQEAIQAATAAGIRVGSGDLNNFFTRQSSSIPSPFEQANPSANMGAPAPLPTSGVNGFRTAPTPAPLPTSGGFVQEAKPPVGTAVAPGTPAPVGAGATLTGEFIPAGSAGGAPPTGLIGAEQALQGGAAGAQAGFVGAEQALRGGLTGALQGITQGRQDIQQGQGSALRSIASAQGAGSRAFQQGIDPIASFISPGQQSQQVQAALSGALGPDAQARAFASFNESPGQAFLRERGERAVTRNAAATGGTQGGRVLQELQRQGIGLAQQDFSNQFDRLGQITGQGQLAAGQAGQLRGQQAGFLGQMGQLRAGAQQGAATQLAGLGTDAANLAFQTGGQLAQNRIGQGQSLFNTGQLLAGGRTRAGEQIAGAALGTGSGLAGLSTQLGMDTSDVLGAAGGNLANLLSGAGAAQAGSQSQLAALLANIATGQGSTIAGLPGIPGIQQDPGIIGGIGQAAAGGGALIAALSDIRLKENIRSAGVSQDGHNLYLWDWNETGLGIVGDQPGFGVIAQELQKTLPDAVTRGADGYLRVDYSRVH